MKEILILRHGKSDWGAPVPSDFERPLNKRGRKASKLMGQKIFEYDLIPDSIISSSAQRAKKTCKIVTKQCFFMKEPLYLDEFYFEDEDFILKTLKSLDNQIERIMLIGHNPILINLILKLISKNKNTKIKLPTAALAQITCNIDSWEEIDQNLNELKMLIYPKLFKYIK